MPVCRYCGESLTHMTVLMSGLLVCGGQGKETTVEGWFSRKPTANPGTLVTFTRHCPAESGWMGPHDPIPDPSPAPTDPPSPSADGAEKRSGFSWVTGTFEAGPLSRAGLSHAPVGPFISLSPSSDSPGMWTRPTPPADGSTYDSSSTPPDGDSGD